MTATIPARASWRSQRADGAGWLASGSDAAMQFDERKLRRSSLTNFVNSVSPGKEEIDAKMKGHPL